MNENAKKISRWASKTGWKVGSHMFEGMFLVSKPDPGGELGTLSRDWRVAHVKRDSKGTRSIEIVGVGHPLHNGAMSVLQQRLAEKGVSPNISPTVNLKGAPAFPVTALD